MKALSLKQPYAELVVSGRKKVELRKWNTKFRGEFLIHASKIPDKNAMKAFGFDKLPLGCIVGKAEITRVKKYQDVDEFNKDKELHLASQEWGNYGFVLENVKRMKEVPCKGKLGFWEFN
ncbi:ACP synthase [Candidatus Pacearchaeota archaeon]|nr:ACP synthase [Candidatus Pacearchaeota archaeon]|tara:strand:+ start:7574 stop:7933 length:360 start_codon:yes stop_codon:yes gene_type:complete